MNSAFEVRPFSSFSTVRGQRLMGVQRTLITQIGTDRNGPYRWRVGRTAASRYVADADDKGAVTTSETFIL